MVEDSAGVAGGPGLGLRGGGGLATPGRGVSHIWQDASEVPFSANLRGTGGGVGWGCCVWRSKARIPNEERREWQQAGR